MHPLVKLLSIVVLAVIISYGHWQGLLFATVFLLIQYGFQIDQYRDAGKMLYRMRWLLLGLLFLYLIFLPYDLLWPWKAQNLFLIRPIFYRLSVLIVMIVAVNWLLQTTTRAQLVGGVYWLIYPLRFIGIKGEKFLLHTFLTLRLLDDLQEYVRQNTDTKKFLLSGLSDWLEQCTRHTTPGDIQIELITAPRLIQFSGLFLLVCLWMLSNIYQ